MDSFELIRTRVLVRIESLIASAMVDEDELVMCLKSHKVRKSARFFLHFVRFIFNFFVGELARGLP